LIYNAIGLQLDTTDAMTSLSARPEEGAIQGFPDEIVDRVVERLERDGVFAPSAEASPA
jgi:hypothetical protein